MHGRAVLSACLAVPVLVLLPFASGSGTVPAAMSSPGGLPTTVRSRYVVASSVAQAIRIGGTIYVAGGISRIAERTGAAIVVPATGGAMEPVRAEIAGGSVRAAVADGHGGWYVGGTFTSVGGALQRSLAHLRPDGTLDTGFAPAAIDNVRTLALVGSTLYVGGIDLIESTHPKAVLRALDAGTGATLPVSFAAPASARCTLALVTAPGRLYAAFADAGVAAYDTATGAAVWSHPVGAVWGMEKGVTTLALTQGKLLAGGGFSDGDNQNLVALDPATGAALQPALKPRGVGSLAVAGGTVYFTGATGIMTVDLSSGAVRQWLKVPLFAGTLGTDGTALYFVGPTTKPDLTVRVYSVEAGSAGAAPKPVSPTLAGGAARAFVFAEQSSRLLVAGGFVGVGGVARHGLAAIDAATGTLKAWAPKTDGAVRALVASGRTIYIGGQFHHVAGASRNGLAAVSADGAGRLLKWHPRLPYADVHTLAVSSGRVFVGGDVKLPGTKPKAPHASLIAVSMKPSGSVVRFNPRVGYDVFALVVWHRTLLVAGHELFAYRAGGTGRQPLWRGRTGGTGVPVVFALAVRGSTLYVGGRFATLNGQGRQSIAAFALDRGGALLPFAPDVQPGVTPTVTSLAPLGSELVFGTVQAPIFSTGRALGAIQADGTLSPWQVEMPCDDYLTSVGDDPGGFNISVDSIVPTANGVFLAGDFTWLGAAGGNQGAGGIAWLR